MAVDRCVCHNLTFSYLKQVADANSANLSMLMQLTDCCSNCGMCTPYVILMLQTGATVFPALSASKVQALMDSARG
ncbi:MAG: (2Fe-2S)-binding protein [Planctomycetes bacterium]|nr:(2Fe-2S)-binding protein [Planctomycetota bacterium]